MYRVTTPVVGFTGMSAGANFTDGVTEIEDGPSLRYFRSAGYGIEELDEPATEPAEEDLDDGAEMPRKSASTEAWRAWAIEHGGLPADVANTKSRDELVAHFTEENDS